MSTQVFLQPSTKYLGPSTFATPTVVRARRPTSADYKQPETGKNYMITTIWQVGKNPSTGSEGELWMLQKIVANASTWILVGTGSAGPLVNITVDAVTAPGVNPVTPTTLGNITFHGTSVVANSIPVDVRSIALNQLQVEVQRSDAVAATDATKNGLSHFNSAQFTVDANGFVSLGGGGLAIDSINVQANTAPGTDPVVGDGTGQITINGTIVAAHSIPLRSNSLAANSLDIEAQYSSAAATSVATNAGMSSFDSDYFGVDANGWVQGKSGIMVGPSNLGIAYSAGTFTVLGARGVALSASNSGYITLQSKANPGQLTTCTVTANQAFIDSTGASTIAGNLFALIDGTATTVDIPFFLYACLADDGTTITFGCSRVPHLSIAPSVANLGCPGTATADIAASIFLFNAVTLANYDLNPVICIGSFRMRFTAAVGGDWTVQALSTTDGIGQFQESTLFQQPLGQFSANAGTITIANGGTAPVFTTTNAEYTISRTGICSYSVLLSGDGGTDGAGAVTAFFTAPFVPSAINTNFKQSLYYKIGAGNWIPSVLIMASPSTVPAFEWVDGSSGAPVTWATFTNTARTVSGSATFSIDTNS